MKDFYSHTRDCFDKYNLISNKVMCGVEDTTDEEDEFIGNFCVYLAHALISDTGFNDLARQELCRVADIIKDVIM